MTKAMLLNELEEGLRGEVSAQVLQENLRYYRQYIDAEIKKGKTEEAVINTLGSGRMIAKTVIEAHGAQTGRKQQNTYQEQETNQQTESRKTASSLKTKMKGIAIVCVLVLLLLGTIGLILHVVWALLPFIILFALLYFFAKKI